MSAVSARPLRAPWVELKYSSTVRPSLKLEMIGVSMISPEGLAIRPRIPASWRTRIESWNPPHGFRDIQLKGPYRRWEHTHTLTAVEGGTLVEDEVTYELPLGPLGRLAHGWLVRPELDRIFAYRRRATEAVFEPVTAEAKAAEASVALAKVSVRAKAAYRQYREKQLTRIRELAKQQAIEPRVVDEHEDYFLSAQESENEAKESVNAATERAATATAKIAQAKADVEQARAEVGVATAELERSKVLTEFAVIRSPYTGVVTRRTFHVGDFIKSADQGGTPPVLSVERTDLMTVVVQVPDRDVPFVNCGDAVVFKMDAFADAPFETLGVSRCAESEDPTTRTMRTEIDVPNPDGRLRRGMYGRVTLTLQTGAANAVRVPTAAVVSRSGAGKGTVRVVRNDRIQTLPVTLGTDNGVEVEVLAGLTASDGVVIRTSGPVDDGAAVAVAGAKAPDAGH